MEFDLGKGRLERRISGHDLFGAPRFDAKPEAVEILCSEAPHTPTAELNITREEHANILIAAAVNQDLIGSSRWHGREAFKGFDWSPPFEEFGQMWETCLTKWMDQPRVAFFFFEYIQTVPEKKLAVYRALLERSDHAALGRREAIVQSCDPILDKELLKAAWDDPHRHCRRVAKERIGKFVQFVGVTRRSDED